MVPHFIADSATVTPERGVAHIVFFMRQGQKGTLARSRAGSALVIATVAIIVAVALSRLLSWGIATGRIADPTAQLVWGYLVFWVPFLVAVLVIARLDIGSARLSFTLIDLLLGLGLGLLLRGVATTIDLIVYGRQASLSIFAPVTAQEWIFFVFTMVLVPIVIAPLLEELFFRGALLSALRHKVPVAVAILISSALFVLVHIAGSPSPTQALATGLTLTVVGVCFATAAVLTGRLGAAIIAHATFNGSLVLWNLL